MAGWNQPVPSDGWSPKTVNLTRQVLHRLFTYAIKHHGFRARDRRYPNPAAGVERRREPAPQIRFLSREQITEQLGVVRGQPVIHALVAAMIYAGLRREEALWLTHNDVDFEARLIRVRAKTIENDSWQPKTKRDRAVPISNALLAILQEYESPFDVIWFFPSPTGRRWGPDNFSHDLRAINITHGLAWSCLDYRHTFGSHLAQRGESLYKIATMMGNSPDICRKHYAALIPEVMHDAVEFESERSDGDGEEGTRRLLEQILREVMGEDNRNTPKLRVLR